MFWKDVESGEAGGMGTKLALSDASIRLGFVRKVFAIVGLQLAICAAMCIAVLIADPVRLFLHQNIGVLFGSWIASFVFMFLCYWRRHHVPYNYILLATFTVLHGVMIAFTVGFYEVQVVAAAVLLTAIAVFALFLFTLLSPLSLEVIWCISLTSFITLIGATVLHLCVSPFSPSGLIACVICTICICAYIIVDLHLIMRYLSPEEWVVACIALYVDITCLFVHILRLLNSSR